MQSGQRREPADEVLVARAKDGDEEAFRELLERHGAELRARVRRQLPPKLRPKLSESDVMQVASLAAYQRLDHFEERGEGSFGRWLNKIADHKVQEVLRRYLGTAKRDARQEVTRPNRPPTANLPDRDASPSENAMAAELQEKLRNAMAALPDDYRLILRLVKQEGLTLAQAGERMGRSQGAAAKLYGRAVFRLSQMVFRKREAER